ncbi:M20 family metallopeptidase [Anaerobacillus sp. 1_MG-2023]|uniref:M20 family metallopeptidase n=1 Tax=Anaerobacillus sp. 1_MG-2023 TaxID=3062655 RepID=UPI0026E42573|nr:M20 family metallopeptidase [Anaerobacillus sp. 1_MG-2023]MDO6658646.1 M20 family metallopeptidase [Anaerobacillus sp. 1_MG-2023]
MILVEQKQRVERDSKEVVALTQELVRIPSVYRPGTEDGNEQAVAEYVASYMKKMGLEVHMEEVEPGRPNVIGILDSGRPGKTLLFEGHTDVVTEGDRSSWTYDPFGAEIVNGRMFGRGTNDTKGNLSCAITAIHSLIQDRETINGKIIMCVPCDEEGMMIGIKHFIEKGWANGVDGAIICEPEENQLCVSQKGAMRIKVQVYGKQAHGAMPLTGVNPNTRMAKIIVALDELEQREKERLGKHVELGWPSITPTILMAPTAGEPQINVVPDQCMTTLDIRTVPGQDHEWLKKEIQSIIDRLAEQDLDFKASLEVIEDRPWTSTDREDPVVKAVAAAYTAVTGKAPVYNGVPGATDGTFLHLAGIPILTTGAGDREVPHQTDEYVDIDDLVETTQLYREAALQFLRK